MAEEPLFLPLYRPPNNLFSGTGNGDSYNLRHSGDRALVYQFTNAHPEVIINNATPILRVSADGDGYGDG